ncbi:MAG: MarR family transcriptional regulator [Halobacteriales archaeon]
MMTDREDIEDLPPSAKLVYKVLEYNGSLTQKEIVARSMLSQRTVRDALARLQEVDAVNQEVYIPDARQNLYELAVHIGPDEETESGGEEAEVGLPGTD